MRRPWLVVVWLVACRGEPAGKAAPPRDAGPTASAPALAADTLRALVPAELDGVPALGFDLAAGPADCAPVGAALREAWSALAGLEGPAIDAARLDQRASALGTRLAALDALRPTDPDVTATYREAVAALRDLADSFLALAGAIRAAKPDLIRIAGRRLMNAYDNVAASERALRAACAPPA